MSTIFIIIIGATFFSFLIFGAFVALAPEWVGIAGKKSQEIDQDHRNKTPETSHHKNL